jgi:hypothetical protein
VAVEGWHPVEDVIEWGFTQAPVVMANEAHDGMARCVRTREAGVRMIRAAHQAGVRRLAMEALPTPAPGAASPIRALPAAGHGYLGQPDMRRLIQTALNLGWSLWAYEADILDPAAPARGTMEHTNWREREQARNLCQVVAAAPAEPLLVWCGNSHASKKAGGAGEWVPMGWHFRTMSGIDQFVIDQAVTVAFPGRTRSWVPELLASLGEVLTACGGTAGILREQAPAPLNTLPGVDAVVVSTDNKLTVPSRGLRFGG